MSSADKFNVEAPPVHGESTIHRIVKPQWVQRLLTWPELSMFFLSNSLLTTAATKSDSRTGSDGEIPLLDCVGDIKCHNHNTVRLMLATQNEVSFKS